MSTILGWIFVILGILSYVAGLAILIKEQFLTKATKALPVFENIDLKGIGDILDKLANALEKFSKLSVPVQWAFLGLVNIGIGAYLLANHPF
jgi:hypothetical protein